MFRKSKLYLLIAVPALVTALFTGCNQATADTEIIKPINGDFSVSYKTSVADYMTFENEEKIPANITFGKYIQYYAPFDSIVKVSSCNKNQKVTTGESLVTLDTTDIDFKINELQIKIAAATSSSTKETYQIQLDELIKKREAAVITAPYDGIISEGRFLVEGNSVKEGELICTVASPDSIYLYNDQGVGKNLRFGMDVKVKINSIEYDATVIAAPDTAPEDASSAARKFCAVKLTDSEYNRFMNENDGIMAADTGWATIYAVTVKRINVLAVPTAAVKTEKNSAYCTVIQNNEKYDLPVEIGAEGGGFTEIRSGLNKGDVVVLAESTSSNNNKK